MYKKILLMCALLVLFIVPAVSATTYNYATSTTPTSVNCTYTGDAQWDGTQLCNLTYDTVWTTYGKPVVGNASTVSLNYTKPSHVQSVMWEHKSGSGSAINSTIPVVCYSSATLQTKVVIDQATGNVTFTCYNGTAWVLAGNASTTETMTGEEFYEGAVWWYLATPAPIVTTLTETGDGLGSLFDSLGEPLAAFIIYLGIAGGVGVLMYSLAQVVKRT